MAVGSSAVNEPATCPPSAYRAGFSRGDSLSRAQNLVPCVRAILENEPDLAPEQVIVVDDGARAGAERSLPAVRWVTGITPFVFARNVNLAMNLARHDVFLVNDDARLMTPRGFTTMAADIRHRREVGVCSTGVRGVVGNPRQLAGNPPHFRYEPRVIAFVCVFLPWQTYMTLGPLDEQFEGYGFEDNDYCARVLAARLKIGIWDGCVVDHSGELTSTFRSRPDVTHLFEQNRRLYRSKWGREL